MNNLLKICFFLFLFFFASVIYSADRKNILVIMDVNDSTGKIKKQFTTSANDVFRKELVSSGSFIIIDKSQQTAALNELLKKETTLTSSKCEEKSCQTIFAKSLSADNIFRSTISQNGTQFIMLSELIDISKETTISEVSVQFDGTLKDLNMAIKEIVERTNKNYSKKQIFAVMNIVDNTRKMKTKDLDLSNDAVRSEILKTGKVIVVDKSRQSEGFNKFLKKEKNLKKCSDKSCQILFAKSLSADNLLYSSVTLNDKKHIASLEVVDVNDGSVIAETSSEFNGKSSELRSVMEGMIEEVLEEIEDELKEGEDDAVKSAQVDATALSEEKKQKGVMGKITHNRPYFWAGTGVAAGGIVLTIVAIGLDVTAAKKFDDFKNKSGDPNLRKDGIAMSKAGFAFYAIGGAALISGAVLALITKENNPPL
ncbi:MAG TPA: hypothetical protein PLX56_11915, partial [bacterium]|nr:hypothetical protein [bacterium]